MKNENILGCAIVIIIALLGFISFTLYQMNQELDSTLSSISSNVHNIRFGR